MQRCYRRFLKDESGAVAIEYGIIATLISIIAIGSMVAIGGQVRTFFLDAVLPNLR